MSTIEDLLAGAKDTVSAKRVYGEPYEKDGLTFIPAAAVRGGGGAGEGEGDDGDESGSGTGGGFGVMARPVGAYQIKGDEVSWVPAADTTRVIIFSEIVVIVALLVLRSILRGRRPSV